MNSSQSYKLLGLREGASISEIKDAYRKLALEYHPDKNISAKDGVKFKMIAEAYHTLRIKNNGYVRANYRTGHHKNKNHQHRKGSFRAWLNLLYSKMCRYVRYAKNVRYYYLKYEPVFFEYCDKIEKNTSILIHRSIGFFRYNHIRTVF